MAIFHTDSALMRLQQTPRLYAESGSQLFQHIQTDSVFSPLDRTDVGAVNAGQVSKRFLGEATLGAKPLQIFRNNIPQRHAGDRNPVWTFQPRSILNNGLPCGISLNATGIRTNDGNQAGGELLRQLRIRVPLNRQGEGGGVSRLVKLALLTLAPALAACSQQPDDYSSSPGTASVVEACKRSDVQDAVGKEARSMVLQRALPGLAAQAMFGLVNVDQVAEDMAQAVVSFSDVGGEPEESSNGSMVVACTGNAKFDTSNATSGQDVVQIKGLRWKIDFADDHPDLASPNFTIRVEEGSIFEHMAINGEPLQRLLDKAAQEEARQQEGAEESDGSGEADSGPSPLPDQSTDAAASQAGPAPVISESENDPSDPS